MEVAVVARKLCVVAMKEVLGAFERLFTHRREVHILSGYLKSNMNEIG